MSCDINLLPPTIYQLEAVASTYGSFFTETIPSLPAFQSLSGSIRSIVYTIIIMSLLIVIGLLFIIFYGLAYYGVISGKRFGILFLIALLFILVIIGFTVWWLESTIVKPLEQQINISRQLLKSDFANVQETAKENYIQALENGIPCLPSPSDTVTSYLSNKNI